MATYLENLITARDNLAAALAAGAGKANYSIDGQTVSYGELFDRWQKLEAMIASSSGPVEVETIGEI